MMEAFYGTRSPPNVNKVHQWGRFIVKDLRHNREGGFWTKVSDVHVGHGKWLTEHNVMDIIKLNDKLRLVAMKAGTELYIGATQGHSKGNDKDGMIRLTRKDGSLPKKVYRGMHLKQEELMGLWTSLDLQFRSSITARPSWSL